MVESVEGMGGAPSLDEELLKKGEVSISLSRNAGRRPSNVLVKVTAGVREERSAQVERNLMTEVNEDLDRVGTGSLLEEEK